MEESAAPKKRRRLAEAEAEAEAETETEAADRISALPDHILHEILAFLPTRLAVSTSLLSRRWRTVWTTAPDVSFTELSRFPDFPSFVDSVLRLRDSAIPLRSFSLVASDDDADAAAAAFSDPAKLHSWMIRCAANSALQRLTLRLPVGSFAAPRRFDVPSAVFHLPTPPLGRIRAHRLASHCFLTFFRDAPSRQNEFTSRRQRRHLEQLPGSQVLEDVDRIRNSRTPSKLPAPRSFRHPDRLRADGGP